MYSMIVFFVGMKGGPLYSRVNLAKNKRKGRLACVSTLTYRGKPSMMILISLSNIPNHLYPYNNVM